MYASLFNEDEEQSEDAEKISKKSIVIVSNKNNIKVSPKLRANKN